MRVSRWVASAVVAASAFAAADVRAVGDEADAAVVVHGVVRGLYRSARGDAGDALVEVDASRVELGARAGDGRQASAPAPGGPVYFHVRPTGKAPAVGTRARVFLVARGGGGWEAAGDDWFEILGTPGAPDAETPSPAPSARGSLGVAVEPVRLGATAALKVTEVVANGPAREAGIEVGDVLVAAGGIVLSDAGKLDEAVAAARGALVVTVRDVRTGKDVPVEVGVGDAAPKAPPTNPSPGPSPRPVPSPAPAGGASSKALGLTVAAGMAGQIPAVKIVAVASGSQAEKAGLEAGDLVTGVDERVVFAPDVLEEALEQAGASFTLTVVDGQSGRKTRVKVERGR